MKTQILLVSILTILFLSPSFGQKLKDKRIEMKYVSLPSEKLPDDFKTYSVKVYGSSLATAGMTADGVAKSIKMDGFKRLSGEGNNFGHLRVSVHTGYVSTGSGEYKSKTTTTKDKEGNEKKSTSYWYEVPFSANISAKVIDPDGNVLATYNSPIQKTLSTTSSSSSSQARKNYNSSVNRLRKGFAKDAVNGIASATRGMLKNKFDFKKVTEFEQFYFIKKHKSEAGFEKHFDKTQAVFKAAKAGTPTKELKSKLAPSMEFYAKEGSIKPGSDKKLKRLYQAANYNLALLHFYLDDLDTSKDYAELVIKSEGKDRRSKNLIERIEKIKKKMDLHDIATMHYTRDVSDAMPPAKVKAFEEEKEELAADNNSTGGTITMDGEQIEGSVMQGKGAEEMTFGDKGNTSFMVEASGEMKEYDLTSDKISAFTIGERKFIKTNFTPMAKGKSEMGVHIMEEVYTSDKINVYKYYPASGALADEKAEFAFKKAAEENPTSLLDTQFLLWNKGLAKYFSDCEDLKGMAAEGGFKMVQDDLIKAARIYSELCE